MLLSRRITVYFSFRAMAQDQVEVMERLGYREFFVAGHDRSARTTARSASTILSG
jgi:haloacetate dehalogenase